MTFRQILNIYCVSIFAILFFAAPQLNAQQQVPGLKVTPHNHDVLSLTSRDYWVAFPQNFDDQPGKFIMLYLSSVDSTMAFIEVNSMVDSVRVMPGVPIQYQVPLSLEMKTSDSVENKAVHVWSNDAALFVDFVSHNPYTSDASYVIPSIGWGQSYVVASYQSLFDGYYDGSIIDDEPSEFVVIANQDSTSVTITPSINLRSSRGDGSLVYPAGIPFTVMLGLGQAVQYKAVVAISDSLTFDVTGTQISSSNPVGVVGASQCANIPAEFPYCDFICEMTPPVRTWGSTYYTAPLYGRVGGDTYLVVGSQAGQTITRTDTNGSEVFATLPNANDHFFRPDVATASAWTSNAPFMLVQYSNSSTWPAGINGNYDPFMMTVNSADHFSTPVIFNLLGNNADAEKPYLWHADIIARSGVTVFVDGLPISSAPIYDDGFCAVYQVDALSPKQHIASSDSGVSVSIYGDSYDDAVGYSGMIGVSTFGSADSIAPHIIATPTSPIKTSFNASDVSPNMSGLSSFEIDSMHNMQLNQAPNFANGGGSETGNFDLVVVDSTKSAHATVRVVDLAGNYTTVIKDYDPSAASVATAQSEGPVTVNPNPANSNFTFQYSLESDNHVTLDLFDLLGNRALSLVNGNQTSGAHTVSADTHLLPVGDYFYRLEIGSVVQSGREVVSR